jgi:hypothetical protein
MQLRAEDASFGDALIQLARTLRKPRGALVPLGPMLGAPLTEALAADLEVGRVRGDIERSAVLAVATSRLGVAGDDAARKRASAAAKGARMRWIQRSRGQPRRGRR